MRDKDSDRETGLRETNVKVRDVVVKVEGDCEGD